MKTRFGLAVLVVFLASGCGALPPEKTRTLKLNVDVSPDHKYISVRNDGTLTLDKIEVYLVTRTQDRYVFKFPEGKTLPPGKTADFLLENLKHEKTGEAFTRWEDFYRFVVHTPTEYWSGGGGSR